MAPFDGNLLVAKQNTKFWTQLRMDMVTFGTYRRKSRRRLKRECQKERCRCRAYYPPTHPRRYHRGMDLVLWGSREGEGERVPYPAQLKPMSAKINLADLALPFLILLSRRSSLIQDGAHCPAEWKRYRWIVLTITRLFLTGN